MAYDFLTGGARSGKSRAAERLAAASGSAVTFVATAEAGDAEMAERIERHRRQRPAGWRTLEEPVDIVPVLAAVDPSHYVIVDCLTLWVANLLDESNDAILDRAGHLGRLLQQRPGGGAVVSNEVGDGIVPADPLTRRYRDLLGTVNSIVAEYAERAFLLVAGRVTRLERPTW